MERKIYFVRHGESVANVRQTFAGQRENSPLTERGREQARAAAKGLISRGVKIGKIISSPLLRAKETMEIIVEEAGLHEVEVIIDERIAEYDMGSLTGSLLRKVTSLELVSAEGVEDPNHFMERVHNLLDELVAFEENVLLVSHAGVGRVIEAKKQGRKAEEFYDLSAYPNAEIIEILYTSPTY